MHGHHAHARAKAFVISLSPTCDCDEPMTHSTGECCGTTPAAHHGEDCCGAGSGMGFHRRFKSREERIAKIEAYLADLQAEAKAVEEHLAHLRGSG